MRKRTSPDRIASTLRDIRADLDAGLNVNQACRKAGINPTTYYRWKTLQENPVSNERIRVCELEAENGRLKTLVAELALDRRMLQEALKKKALLQSEWVLFCLGEPKDPCFQGEKLTSHGSKTCRAVSHGRENKSCCCSSRDS